MGLKLTKTDILKMPIYNFCHKGPKMNIWKLLLQDRFQYQFFSFPIFKIFFVSFSLIY